MQSILCFLSRYAENFQVYIDAHTSTACSCKVGPIKSSPTVYIFKTGKFLIGFALFLYLSLSPVPVLVAGARLPVCLSK